MTASPPDKLDAIERLIVAAGLDFQTIKAHRDMIRAAALSGRKPEFKVLDTCRIENGGILPASWPGPLHLKEMAAAISSRPKLVAFTPAAGAASRYYAPLAPLIEAVGGDDTERLIKVLNELREKNAASWPLPAAIQALIEAPHTASHLSDETRTQLRSMLHWPKALLPHARDAMSFLKAKQTENLGLGRLVGEVYVTPAGRSDDFEAELATNPALGSKGEDASLPRLLLEQGMTLSSIRFLRSGDPYLEPSGDISVVPAGHGALAELFPRVRDAFAGAECILIRNIDNVTGNGEGAMNAAGQFLDAHAFAWQAVQRIRQELTDGRMQDAAMIAQSLWDAVPESKASPLAKAASAALDQIRDPSLQALWRVQLCLFNTPVHLAAKLDFSTVKKLFERPLNILGQVPNSGKDLGGTPCFVSHAGADSSGERYVESLKLCLELPHASEGDKRDFLARPELATHFNPVFVVAELTSDPHYYSRQNNDFWVLAEKSHRGSSVAYFETVLFELLGNSAFANALFIEIPRLLFNPHKTLEDSP